ncbi:tetratricopeptide repeat protein [Flavobacteriaceae bacterium S356]|uniref:Oxygen sensor histidine kinase NreB n=1 Tax=Asprobacillus argus TaxID=3076534 RepID=A0ABU3LIJ2_9FLAO|nr:tetratricopeptide repeat protein [Flavobacteriaceae bacterium S356]
MKVSLLKIAVLLYALVFSLQSRATLILPTLQTQQDSITIWIKAAKNKNYTSHQQKVFLEKAYNQVILKEGTNAKANQLSTIAYRFYELKDTLNFQKINEETLKLAYKLKDSFGIADAQWSYADYYLNGEAYTKAYPHYSIAYDYFNGIHKEYQAARMLYSMAFIKSRYRDYTGSEVLLFEAIKKFKPLKNYKYLFESYNSLALIQIDIKEYEKALFYNEKALEYIEKIEVKDFYLQASLNNIGLTYLKKGKYKKAIKYFNKVLDHDLSKTRYARAIDNRAFCKLMLGDTSLVKKDMLRALKIRDSTNNKAGIVSSKIRLSKYYTYIKDTTTAFKYAREANGLANKVKNGVDYLESLDLMANLDPQNSEKYLRRHIQYNDSLIAVERKVQNKFTRIDFETDEYIEETKRLSEQKIWILSSGAGVLLILSLLYFLRIQKAKTEKLLLETEQQKANEQVYLLTIQQQTILEEEKVKERNRISEELHDGILGKLFGTRVGLGFLDVNADEKVKEQHQSFLDELQEIEKEIRDVSHKLNTSFESSKVNFSTIIEQLLKDKSTIGDFKYSLQIEKNISWKDIDQVTKVNIYRILQEALQNITKHAHAQLVTVDFSAQNSQLVVFIKDDGSGFQTQKRKGIGLKNMRSRVQKLKGTIEVSSMIGQGTSILIKIPM